MSTLSRTSLQRHRVNRVVNHVYEHTTDVLDLARLADVACLSKFHFARVFSAHLGETPLQFVWRVRLERAARNLLYLPEQSITQVALDAGFSSPQSFSGAFQYRYRISPRYFRSQRTSAQTNTDRRAQSEIDLRWPHVQCPRPEHLLLNIQARPRYRVAYIRHIGPYAGKQCKISKVYERLEGWARLRGLWHETSAAIGLCPDHSAFTPREMCLYDASLIVPDAVPEDDVVSVQTVPAGTYAVLKVKCRAAQMDNIWEWFTSIRLPSSGLAREVLPCYEYYPPAAGGSISPENGVELCVRLRGC